MIGEDKDGTEESSVPPRPEDAEQPDSQETRIQLTQPEDWTSLWPHQRYRDEPVEDFLPGAGVSGVPLRRPERETDDLPPGEAVTFRPAPEPRRRPPLWRWIAKWLFLLVAGFVLLSVVMVGIYRFVPPPVTLTMIGDVIGGHGATRYWRPLSDIDPDMARAVIGAEDSKFCEHNGFDWEAMENAWRRNRQGGRIRGGSTISQQTAKNVFLWQGGGYARKGLEAWFTFLIERLWGKRRIMEVYLNVAETGIGTYGVEAGARRYFKHGADTLSTREAAQIAAVLPLPKKRAGTNPTGFTRRYANTIAARIGTVRTQGLDACVR